MTPSWWWRTSTTTCNRASPLDGGLARREVGFAVIATTAVLVMVFVPIAFMDGMVGRLFTEFAILLLSPGRALLLPGGAHPDPGHGLLADACRGQAQRPDRHPGQGTWLGGGALSPRAGAVLRRAVWMPLVLLLCLGGIGALFGKLPASLTPTEDRGVLYVFVKGRRAPASSG